tara:strand:- start:652 stop:1047 length:396 start_codon:yes stop_codon:yes gene_type:complete
MTLIKNRTIRYISTTVSALVVSSSLLAMPSAAGERASVYRHHQQEREWSGDRHVDRLFRRILRSVLVHPENHLRYRHRHADVRWAKAHRRHKTREVCRIKAKIVFDDYGYRRKITRKVCRDAGPGNHQWRR